MKIITLCLLVFLSIFVTPSFAENFHWNCWGWEKYSDKDYDRKTNLSYSSDICVRTDEKPLFLDVYLHEMEFSGSANSINMDITVKVKNKRTNFSQVLSLIDSSEVYWMKEYVKRFEFPVVLSGEYEIDILSIKVTYRKNGKTTGYFNNINTRSGVSVIKSDGCCCQK